MHGETLCDRCGEVLHRAYRHDGKIYGSTCYAIVAGVKRPSPRYSVFWRVVMRRPGYDWQRVHSINYSPDRSVVAADLARWVGSCNGSAPEHRIVECDRHGALVAE